MDPAAAQPLSIVMWIRPAHASGIRSMNGLSSMGREELLLEVLPPLDWEKVGTGFMAGYFQKHCKHWLEKTI